MGRQHQTIPVGNREIVAIADPHLESVPDDVERMIQFVGTLKPAEHVLLFLGDLFHVWTASGRYHTARQKQLLDELSAFRSQGGLVFLTAGNRDLFFEDKTFLAPETGLPFDAIGRNFLRFHSGDDVIVAHHGDTVNLSDSAYLRWRKIVRSAWVKSIFNIFTAKRGKQLLYASEKRIKKTNSRFKIYFPEENWRKFVEEHHECCSPRLLLVGHFHPQSPVIAKQGSTTGIVVPSWHMTQAYLTIDAQLRFQMRRFNEGV